MINLFIFTINEETCKIKLMMEFFFVNENGKRTINQSSQNNIFLQDKKHKFNKELGVKFSVHQTTYTINENYLDDLLNEKLS